MRERRKCSMIPNSLAIVLDIFLKVMANCVRTGRSERLKDFWRDCYGLTGRVLHIRTLRCDTERAGREGKVRDGDSWRYHRYHRYCTSEKA